MWKIEKPTTSAIKTFDICIAGITNTNLKARLQGVRSHIITAETAFEAAAQSANLLSIKPATSVGGSVTKKEMDNLYTRHMARGGSHGRDIYDELMIAAPFDQCPFCGHGSVSTLDHCLPKAQHPALAVTPVNLIPSCKDCNHEKGNLNIKTPADQLLNAYYDDVTNERWLFAQIVQGSPPGATFFVTVCGKWSDEMARRVQNHFSELKLARLYASQAGRMLQNMRLSLAEIFDADGAEAVQEDLLRQYRSYSDISVNSWEGALFEAAAASDWFCDQGFRS